MCCFECVRDVVFLVFVVGTGVQDLVVSEKH